MNQIYDYECATIYKDEDNHLVQVTWLRHCEGQALREVLTQALQLANKENLRGWLCDMRGLLYMSFTDQNWLAKEHLPQLNSSYQLRFAYIISETNLELFASLRVQALVQEDPQLEKFIEIEVFTNQTLAIYWLHEVQNSN